MTVSESGNRTDLLSLGTPLSVTMTTFAWIAIIQTYSVEDKVSIKGA